MKKQLRGKIKPLNKEKTKWLATVNLGWNEEKKIYDRERRTFYGNTREAEAYLRELIAELEKDPDENPGGEEQVSPWSDEFLSEWLDYYLETVVPVELSWEKNTFERAARIIHTNIKPYIGTIPLYALEPQHIIDMYGYLRKSGKIIKIEKDAEGKIVNTERGPLSARTVRYVHVILNQSLDYAVKLKKISDNPAKGLTPANDKEKPRNKWVVLDEKGLADFLSGCENHIDFVLILAAAYSGCRESELFGLEKDKVLQNALRIEKALHLDPKSKDGFEHRPRTKNETSTRTVIMEKFVMDIIRKYIGQQEAKGINNKLVFTEPDGSPMDRKNLSHRFANLANKLKHPGMRFHDLRHTHATILLSSGANINEVAERLGHADPSITLSLYGHVLPGRDQSLSDRFTSLVPFQLKIEE